MSLAKLAIQALPERDCNNLILPQEVKIMIEKCFSYGSLYCFRIDNKNVFICFDCFWSMLEGEVLNSTYLKHCVDKDYWILYYLGFPWESLLRCMECKNEIFRYNY